MTDIIHAFFLGAAFVAGAFTGLFLCTISFKKGRDELQKDIREHNKLVEARLLGYVDNTARIATAVEILVEIKDHERRNK